MMYLSVVTAPVQPDKWDEIASLYQEFVASMVGGDSGILSAYLARVGDSNNAISVVTYESEEKALASAEPNGAFTVAVSKLVHTFAGAPERKIGEVIAHQS